MTKIPFFLFPGLTCTDRIFRPQKDALSDLCEVIVPDWIEPRRGERLEDFARRWGESVWQNHFSQNARPESQLDPEMGGFIGGLSFGGMVFPFAGDVLRKHGVPIHAGLRISTVRYGKQIPASFCFWWNSLCLLPFGGWNFVRLLCALSLKLFPQSLSFARRETYLQILESPAIRSKRVLRMIAGWREDECTHDFPILQLHGLRDRLLPLRLVEAPEVQILDAGHEMTLTRPEEVNRFLRGFLNHFMPN